MIISNETRQEITERTTKSKREKLISFANSVLNDQKFSTEFDAILTSLRLNKSEVMQHFLEYNLDIYSSQGNAVYESLENRVVLHIHNLLKGSWHIERQNVMQEMVEKANATTIADIGFGVPSQYIKNLIIKKNRFKLTLCDLYEPAFVFAKTLLSLWDSNWSNNISFLKTNMDLHEFIGNFGLYIFQDSIEHTPNPDLYLSKYVKLSDYNAKFLISLPIGPIIPRHFIAWETVDEAINWLGECGLTVDMQQLVFVNPVVDLFAEQIGECYCDLIVLCSKKYMLL